ncbi:MAG: tetratricopeptide repeat protein, partial [Okeania sp. SIO3H1]|nr:tetratricopeptide repeat protein [Okeania sp. SIO3H1]
MTKTDFQSSQKLTFLTTLDNTNSQSISAANGIFSIFSAFPEFDRGNRMYNMGRYESAISYYENAVKIK